MITYAHILKITLKTTSDKLTENMHQFVGKCICISWYKVKDVKNINHGIKLCQAILHVNCYNLNKKNIILCFIKNKTLFTRILPWHSLVLLEACCGWRLWLWRFKHCGLARINYDIFPQPPPPKKKYNQLWYFGKPPLPP